MQKFLMIILTVLYLNASNLTTSVLNIDPWVYVTEGRYGESAIKATSVSVGHTALEVVTISLDCLENKIIPNLSYSFMTTDGFNEMKWWDKVNGNATIIVDNKYYEFERATYNIGNHPYMLSDKIERSKFIFNLINSQNDLTFEVKISKNKYIRNLTISNQGIKNNYNKLLTHCKGIK